MLKEQILSELCVELGVAFQKAGKRLADVSTNGEVVTTDLKEEGEKEAPAKKTSKKTAKKTTAKKQENAYTAKKPPKGATQTTEFRKQWAKMNADEQEAYLNSEIDSLKNPLASAKTKEEVKPLGDDEDFGEDEAEDKSFTADDVRKALQAYSKKHSKEEALSVLAQFGVKKVSGLSEEQYEDVIQELS